MNALKFSEHYPKLQNLYYTTIRRKHKKGMDAFEQVSVFVKDKYIHNAIVIRHDKLVFGEIPHILFMIDTCKESITEALFKLRSFYENPINRDEIVHAYLLKRIPIINVQKDLKIPVTMFNR